MQVVSAQGQGSTFSFTSMHDTPTRQELLDFLRESDAEKSGPQMFTSAAHSAANGTATQIPHFRKICVAEDNPCVAKPSSRAWFQAYADANPGSI